MNSALGLASYAAERVSHCWISAFSRALYFPSGKSLVLRYRAMVFVPVYVTGRVRVDGAVDASETVTGTVREGEEVRRRRIVSPGDRMMDAIMVGNGRVKMARVCVIDVANRIRETILKIGDVLVVDLAM